MSWTERELINLQDNFPLQGANARGLQHLSKQVIYKKADELGLERETLKRTNGEASDWTTGEVALLREHYPFEGSYIPELLFNHSRTAIQCKAKRLGISYIKRSER